MTPNEKALELYEKYLNVDLDTDTPYVNLVPTDAKKLAMICVNEILSFFDEGRKFWFNVKAELEAL